MAERNNTTAPAGSANTPSPRREIEDRFINEWGLLANAWGVSPLLGRIHGLLLLAGRPMTAEEVCERLDISRASASVQLNAILGWGLARRMYLPGDRRQHYLAEPEPWTWFRRAVRVRKEREFDPVIAGSERGRGRSPARRPVRGRRGATRRSRAAGLPAEVRASVLRRHRDVSADRAERLASVPATCRRGHEHDERKSLTQTGTLDVVSCSWACAAVRAMTESSRPRGWARMRRRRKVRRAEGSMPAAWCMIVRRCWPVSGPSVSAWVNMMVVIVIVGGL